MIFIIGSSFKNSFWLRVAIVFGSIFEIIFFLNIADTPVWAEILWIILIDIVNIYMIIIILLEKGFVKFNKDEVLSVSGDKGIVNQIDLFGRSYAGKSVSNYHIVDLGDIVYTKSPLKANPFGIIKLNKINSAYTCYEDNFFTGFVWG